MLQLQSSCVINTSVAVCFFWITSTNSGVPCQPVALDDYATPQGGCWFWTSHSGIHSTCLIKWNATFWLKVGNRVLIHSTMSLLFSHPDPHQQELYKKYCEFLPPITSGATEGTYSELNWCIICHETVAGIKVVVVGMCVKSYSHA